MGRLKTSEGGLAISLAAERGPNTDEDDTTEVMSYAMVGANVLLDLMPDAQGYRTHGRQEYKEGWLLMAVPLRLPEHA